MCDIRVTRIECVPNDALVITPLLHGRGSSTGIFLVCVIRHSSALPLPVLHHMVELLRLAEYDTRYGIRRLRRSNSIDRTPISSCLYVLKDLVNVNIKLSFIYR